jgi:hypothetical protein
LVSFSLLLSFFQNAHDFRLLAQKRRRETSQKCEKREADLTGELVERLILAENGRSDIRVYASALCQNGAFRFAPILVIAVMSRATSKRTPPTDGIVWVACGRTILAVCDCLGIPPLRGGSLNLF